MEQIDDIERVFRDITKQSYVKCLDAAKSKDYEGNYAAKLQSSEGYLSKLKTSYVAMVAKSLFLDYLSKDQENWPSSNDTEENYTSMNADRSMKIAAEDYESKIIETAKQLQTKQELVKKGLADLEAKLDSVKAKKQEFVFLQQKAEVHARERKEKEKATKALKEQKQQQMQTDFAIKQCNTAIRSIEQNMEILRSEVKKLQTRVYASKHNLQEAEKLKQQTDQEKQDKTMRLQGLMQLMETLHGFKVKTIDDDSLVLEFTQQHPTESPPPELKLKFELCEMKPRLCGAEINIDSLEIDDLVQAATETRDAAYLVHGVQTRLRNYQGLRQEIEDLQKKYAMDWEPGANRIRVMLGRSGNTVCTLVIGSSYPAQDSVSLLKVESKQQHADPQTLRPTRGDASLSEWIQYLQEVFSRE